MNNQGVDDDDIPAEIDFSKGTRGLHYIPAIALPESELVREVLRRDIEINEALK
jgi:hypothetical protein